MTNLKIKPLAQIAAVTVGEQIFVHTPVDELFSKIRRANTFTNPKYESNQRHGFSNWQTPPTIETYKVHQDGSISIPRGFLHEFLSICHESGIDPIVEDLRSECPVDFPALKGITLRPYQQKAVDLAMESDQGVFVSPTGSGKSLIGLEIIRRRKQKALIIVHRFDLAKQWVSVISERMGLIAGFIGDGGWEISNEITVAMVQTLAGKENETKAISNAFGLILLDEAHHAPAQSFFDVVGQMAAKFRYGLSATPNLLIIELAQRSEGASLVLVDRVAHAEQLSEMLLRRNIDHVLAHGKIAKNDRENVMERIRAAKLTVGTTGLLGEGLDVDVWMILIMGSPISSEIKLMQAIGRIVRPANGKEKAFVYDLKDDCAFAGSSFKKRFEIYKKHKIWVEFNENKKSRQMAI